MSKNAPIALYVHWPFCKAKCPYCDFNSHVREGVDGQAWRKALLTELRYMAGLLGPRTVTSVFFGGGTPSLMEAATVEAILREADTVWGLDAPCEITLEANPTSVEAAKFRDFRAAGVNRVSIGVQALHDDALKALGRMHSAAEAREAVRIAATTFDRYSFDLIYARPNQTPQQWEAELKEAMGMMGDHLSAYQLTIEPNTQFYTLYHSGRLAIPDEDAAAAFYDVTQTLMDGAGMPAYEVSNHAKAGCESRHNLTYWKYGEYAGIGPGAHGRVFVTPNAEAATPTLPHSGPRTLVATRTHRAPEEWLARVQQGGHGYHPHEAVDARAATEEKLMMGLRLRAGIALADIDTSIVNLQKAAALRKEGLLESDEARLVPTLRGRLVLTALNSALLR